MEVASSAGSSSTPELCEAYALFAVLEARVCIHHECRTTFYRGNAEAVIDGEFVFYSYYYYY